MKALSLSAAAAGVALAACGGPAAPDEPAAPSTAAAAAITAPPLPEPEGCWDERYLIAAEGWGVQDARAAAAAARWLSDNTDIDPCGYSHAQADEMRAKQQEERRRLRAEYQAAAAAAEAEANPAPPAPPPSTQPAPERGAPEGGAGLAEEEGSPSEVSAEEGELGTVTVTIPPGEPVEIDHEPPPEPEQPEIVVVPASTTEPPGDDVLPEPDNPNPEPLGKVRLTSSVLLSEVADIDLGLKDSGGHPASETCVFAHGFARGDLIKGAQWEYHTDAAPGEEEWMGAEVWTVEKVTIPPAERPETVRNLAYWQGQVNRQVFWVYPDETRRRTDLDAEPNVSVHFYAGADGRLHLSAPPGDCGG